MLDETTLTRILDALPELSIALVGDLFLDKYLDLDSTLTETSVETGLDAYQIARVRCYPGAGGTVLNNLRALGVGKLYAISVIGDDGEGYELRRALHDRQVDTTGVVVRSDRMTPTYTKPMLSQDGTAMRELNRLDIKNRCAASADQDRQVIARLEALAGEVDAVIIADQVTERNQGVITDVVRERLAQIAVKNPKCVFLADSRRHIGLFRNCLTKPNRGELLAAVAPGCSSESSTISPANAAVLAAASELSRRTRRGVYVTVGPDGILFVEGNSCCPIPGVPVTDPIDIVGAGDSTTAGIVSALCAGATPAEAARVGCVVASITIQQLGITGTANPAQVLERFRESRG
jgi:rfaE bifunctional protein kinase chain/domain